MRARHPDGDNEGMFFRPLVETEQAPAASALTAGCESNNRQRAVFIIGAGRSGTSAIARGVTALGVDLGKKFKAATRKNPTGFFEHVKLLALSKRVRRAVDIRADSVRLIPAEALQSMQLEPMRLRACKIIQRDFGRSPVWGFKYGRTLRILPFWEPLLESLSTDASFVIALRNPLSVARSRAKLDPRRGVQAVSDLEWLVSIVPFLRLTRGRPLAVVDYDLLMDAPVEQLQRLARLLQLPMSDTQQCDIEAYANEFLRTGMRHTRFTDEDLDRAVDLNPLVRNAYRLLYRLANDEWSSDDPRFWDAWTGIEKGMEILAPALGLLDASEAERRRAIMYPLGFLHALTFLRNIRRR
jgi:hypothetical protein